MPATARACGTQGNRTCCVRDNPAASPGDAHCRGVHLLLRGRVGFLRRGLHARRGRAPRRCRVACFAAWRESDPKEHRGRGLLRRARLHRGHHEERPVLPGRRHLRRARHEHPAANSRHVAPRQRRPPRGRLCLDDVCLGLGDDLDLARDTRRYRRRRLVDTRHGGGSRSVHPRYREGGHRLLKQAHAPAYCGVVASMCSWYNGVAVWTAPLHRRRCSNRR
mmetsp:Transcript_24710/g.72223  ORF Transcript_24710/g.72223 Transcript_24710/m.72223 type:complete len:221 (-) Transcript_24710:184-846(-)